MTPTQAGQRGGTATRKNHVTICPCCGQPIKSEFFTDTGKKGGKRTLQAHGRDFYSRIGHLGGRGNTREKRLGRNCSDQPLPERSGVT